MDATDITLSERAARRDSDATAELFRRHWPAAWHAAFAVCGSRALADEIAQDAFERALRTRPQLNGSGSLGPWLKRVAVNRAIDVMRSETRQRRLRSPDRAEPEWLDGPAPEPGLARAVAALEPERRIPVVLHYWLDYTQPEIAELLGIPLGTVSSRISRALQTLREQLGDES